MVANVSITSPPQPQMPFLDRLPRIPDLQTWHHVPSSVQTQTEGTCCENAVSRATNEDVVLLLEQHMDSIQAQLKRLHGRLDQFVDHVGLNSPTHTMTNRKAILKPSWTLNGQGSQETASSSVNPSESMPVSSNVNASETMPLSSTTATRDAKVKKRQHKRESKIISKIAVEDLKRQRKWIARVVHSVQFELVVGLLIVANAFYLGYEMETQHLRDEAFIIQLSFSIFFSIEILFRIFVDRWRFFLHNRTFNVIDILTVSASLFEVAPGGKLHNIAANSTVFRILRLLRLVRLANLMRLSFFRELRLMVASLINCFKPMAWTLFLLLMVMYMFSLMFTEGVRGALSSGKVFSPKFSEAANQFATIAHSMKTLLSSLFGGVDWLQIVDMLSEMHFAYALLFFAYILFAQLALLNVVTGIFVECSIRAALNDKQMMVQDQMTREGVHKAELEQLFAEADSQGDGFLTTEGLHTFLSDVGVRAFLKVLDITYKDPSELVVVLDCDADGIVTIDDFVAGCISYKSIQTVDIFCLLQGNHRQLSVLQDVVGNIERKLEQGLHGWESHVV